MAQQKPGVMLYFEMRNVFEELSNEKRESWSARFSITVNTASSPISVGHCGLHGLLFGTSWTGTMIITPAKARYGGTPFTFVKAKRTVCSRFPMSSGLHPFPKPANQKHQMIPIGIQLQLQPQQQPQPQQQQQQQPQQQPQQIVVICPWRASRPDNHSDRFPPRWRRFVLTPHSGATRQSRLPPHR